jgi:hypothetical protein
VLGDALEGRTGNLWLDGMEFLHQIVVKNEEGQQTPSNRYSLGSVGHFRVIL